MKTLRVAIAGFGSVGRATASLLLGRRERYLSQYGLDVRLVAVCGSKAGLFNLDGIEEGHFNQQQKGLTGPDFILQSGADVVIEAGPSDFRTGGPGYAYIQSALEAKRDVIAISKGALVFDGPGLRRLASKSGATLKISGATAAALPTIDLLDYNLKGCEVLKVEGILNATTNFLLDTMMQQGSSFAQALASAQAGGFAESDTSYDTQGWDTACKLLILANFGLGATLTIDDVSVEGIEDVTTKRINQWREQNLVPKLVGVLSRQPKGYKATVGIQALTKDDPLSLVAGNNKAIRITTDVMGDVIAIGGNSGPQATAAAALKDFEHLLMKV
ncbi:MAG: homoserine dehydrogenase [Algicola sp.]|nr:homoserine dehydrogenase [Algicola sp.]